MRDGKIQFSLASSKIFNLTLDMTQVTTTILPSQAKPSQAKPSLSWLAAGRGHGAGRFLRRLPVAVRCLTAAQDTLAGLHGYPVLIAAHAYSTGAIGLNGTLKPALPPHRCRPGHSGPVRGLYSAAAAYPLCTTNPARCAAPQPHSKRCNSRRETVVCPLFSCGR